MSANSSVLFTCLPVFFDFVTPAGEAVAKHNSRQDVRPGRVNAGEPDFLKVALV